MSNFLLNANIIHTHTHTHTYKKMLSPFQKKNPLLIVFQVHVT